MSPLNSREPLDACAHERAHFLWNVRRPNDPGHEAEEAGVGAPDGEQDAGPGEAAGPVHAAARVERTALLVVHAARRPAPHAGILKDVAGQVCHNKRHSGQCEIKRSVLLPVCAPSRFALPVRKLSDVR